MAKWIQHLNLKDIWTRFHSEENLAVQEVAEAVANRLSQLTPYPDYIIEKDRQDFIESFRDMSIDHDTDVTDFDREMEDLYDWADQPLVLPGVIVNACWITTV